MKSINCLNLSAVGLVLAACGGGLEGNGGVAPEGSDSGAGGAESGGTSSSGGKAMSSTGGSGVGGDPASGGAGGDSAPGGTGGGPVRGSGGDGAGGSAGSGGRGAGGSIDDGGIVGSGGSISADAGPDTVDGGAAPDVAPVAPPPAGVVAYAYAADKESTAAYEPAPAYRFNVGIGTVTIERTGVGLYAVDVTAPGVPMRNVQVTAYDQASHCSVSNFGSTAATVMCRDAAGTPVNSRFSFIAFGPKARGAGFVGYAWADDQDNAQYPVNTTHAYHSSAGAVTATRAAAGDYSVQFAGLNLLTGNVQVTAYGTANHCNVRIWSGDDVGVRCYDAAGALADARFEVLITQASVPVGPAVRGYMTAALAGDPGGDVSASDYTFNATGGATTASRSGPGAYNVRFAGTNLSGGHVQITAVASNRHCNVRIFATDQVGVSCYDPSGAPADSRFSLVAIH
jgi:hypothetical protein